MIRIEFTTFGANSAFGGFAPGDTLRCDPDLARHLVEEIKCAKYAKVKAQPEVVEAVELIESSQKRTRKAK